MVNYDSLSLGCHFLAARCPDGAEDNLLSELYGSTSRKPSLCAKQAEIGSAESSLTLLLHIGLL